ncbi:unnamed protein product, partial [Didymodactylos carnosus]
MKTNLSCRIGSLFKMKTDEENIRKRVADTLHSVAETFNELLTPYHLGVNHLSRDSALQHHTAYTKAFFGDQLSMIWDGTYFYIHKSNDHRLQRSTFSGQKYRNLVKFMSLVFPDGYILDVIGPFYATDNDATISKYILRTIQGLDTLTEDGDVQIVDRGFRDAAQHFKELGYDVKMPGLMERGSKQLALDDANTTRLVTKCRWVVESFHALIKKWRFFSERIDNSFLPSIKLLIRVLASSNSKKMLELQNTTSDLAEEITSFRLFFEKKWIPMKGCGIDFPQLSLEYLRHFTCGSYQLKQSKANAKSHLDENGDFDVELSPDKDNLLRCRIQS